MTTVRYEAPQINLELTKDDIHQRYQDIALLIFQVNYELINKFKIESNICILYKQIYFSSIPFFFSFIFYFFFFRNNRIIKM